MSIDVLSFDSVHPLSESAAGAIAHFSGPLASLLLVAGDGHASSSRLARGPEKCTLAPAQLPNPG